MKQGTRSWAMTMMMISKRTHVVVGVVMRYPHEREVLHNGSNNTTPKQRDELLPSSFTCNTGTQPIRRWREELI